MKTTRTLLIGLAALALIGGAVACSSDDDGDDTTAASPTAAVTAAGPAPAPAAITVTASDFTLAAPDTFPAGRVAVTFRNEGQEIHHAQFLRLNDGVTAEQFATALAEGVEAAGALATDAGGPGAVSPGRSAAITQDFAAGSYIMLCFIPGPDEIPHVAKGMLRPFQVAGPATSVPEVVSDGTVILGDFTILMPSVKAGTNTFAVTNAGKQSHEVVFARLGDDVSFADAEPFLQGRGPLPAIEAVGGTVGMASGQNVWTTVELSAGNYLALCVIPDVATGAPHFLLGMATTFTVP